MSMTHVNVVVLMFICVFIGRFKYMKFQQKKKKNYFEIWVMQLEY